MVRCILLSIFAFLALIDMVLWFLFRHIFTVNSEFTFIGFRPLTEPCMPGTNSTWLGYIIICISSSIDLLIYCEQFFMSMFIRDSDMYCSLLALGLFLVSESCLTSKKRGRVFSPL